MTAAKGHIVDIKRPCLFLDINVRERCSLHFSHDYTKKTVKWNPDERYHLYHGKHGYHFFTSFTLIWQIPAIGDKTREMKNNSSLERMIKILEEVYIFSYNDTLDYTEKVDVEPDINKKYGKEFMSLFNRSENETFYIDSIQFFLQQT